MSCGPRNRYAYTLYMPAYMYITYSVCLHNSGFRVSSIQSSPTNPAIKLLKWKHPSSIHRPKSLQFFSNMSNQMQGDNLINVKQ